VNVCIPVNEEQGLSSSVCQHFGGTPMFLLVNSENRTFRVLRNQREGHTHGHCSPLAALSGQSIDAIVVGGIGRGAIAQLEAARIPVYLAEHPTAAENVDALASGKLRLISASDSCAHPHGESTEGQSHGGHGCCGHG
jgi:predicted Fe-Mo cluster-binding NifX family protein